MRDNVSDCKTFKLYQGLGIDAPCEWCYQHTRHIHDTQSFDALVECVGDDGKLRRQRFNGQQITEAEMFAVDRFAEITVRNDMKKAGEDFLHPSEDTIRLRVEHFLCPRQNCLTGKSEPSFWATMPHPKRIFSSLSE